MKHIVEQTTLVAPCNPLVRFVSCIVIFCLCGCCSSSNAPAGDDANGLFQVVDRSRWSADTKEKITRYIAKMSDDSRTEMIEAKSAALVAVRELCPMNRRALIIEDVSFSDSYQRTSSTRLLLLPEGASLALELEHTRVIIANTHEWELVSGLADKVAGENELLPCLPDGSDFFFSTIHFWNGKKWNMTVVMQPWNGVMGRDINSHEKCQGLLYSCLMYVIHVHWEDVALQRKVTDYLRMQLLPHDEYLLLLAASAFGGSKEALAALERIEVLDNGNNGKPTERSPQILEKPEKGREKGEAEMGENGHESPSRATLKP